MQDNYNLDDYISNNNIDNNKQLSVKPEQSLTCQAQIADMQAVKQLADDIMDKRTLAGMSDNAILCVYMALQALPDYKTPELVKQSDDRLADYTLSPQAYLYLLMIDQDITPAIACKALQISKSQPILWSKDNKLYTAILDAIKEAQAEQLEAEIWQSPQGIERMFALKARKPEYKDNAPPAAPPAINLNVTIDNRQIEIREHYKDITPMADEEKTAQD